MSEKRLSLVQEYSNVFHRQKLYIYYGDSLISDYELGEIKQAKKDFNAFESDPETKTVIMEKYV